MKIIIAALISVTACSPAYADYQLQRIIRNSGKIESMRGTLAEKGVVSDGGVKSTVVFERPNRFAFAIEEPREWAGTSVTYDGKTLVFHYPKIQTAIRFRNLDIPADARMIEYQYRKDIAAYDYELAGTSKVADLPAVVLRHAARSTKTHNRRGWTKVYDKYSFPLAGEYNFAKAQYAYGYEKIEFNQPIDDQIFETKIPENTWIADWDLAAPAWEGAPPANLPEAPLGLTRTKIIRAAGPIPTFLVRYDRGPHFVLITTFPSAGMTVPDYGIPIDEGRLILGPAMSSYSFIRGGTYYSLLGNIPYQELLELFTSR